MKSKLLVTLAAAAVAAALGAGPVAAVDADAAQALAKKSGCLKCHAVEKTKKGPSFQKTAAKYKGKTDGVAKVTDSITKGAKIKMEDGTMEEHKVIESKDQKEINNLVQWILAQ